MMRAPDQPALAQRFADDLKAIPPEQAHYMRRRIPRSQLCIIDAQGHLPHLSEPDQVLAALQDFGL